MNFIIEVLNLIRREYQIKPALGAEFLLKNRVLEEIITWDSYVELDFLTLMRRLFLKGYKPQSK